MTAVDNTGDMQAVIDVATLSAAPAPLHEADARYWMAVTPAGGTVHTIDLEEMAERHGLTARPRRKTGVFVMHDADSFVRYLRRHSTEDTEVWADAPSMTVSAYLNGHGVDAPGHHDHVARLRLQPTPAWAAWKANDRGWLQQLQFAELIEDRLPDITEPAGAEMLELAQSFSAKRSVQFESSKALSSGEVQLEYREQIDATAGKAGRLNIPQSFALALAPFEGSPIYKVTARLRYRITDHRLQLSYALDRPEDVLDAAFGDVCTEIAAGIDSEVLRGRVGGGRDDVESPSARVDFSHLGRR